VTTWFGGKSRVAHVVWERFGDVPNYVEPFAGSLAVLLTRPHAPRIETVNDADCYLANFWRALQAAPDEVARWADWPVNEVDLHARHRWLLDRADFRRRMVDDPDYHDAKVAGWWVWGICQWIGAGWCDARFYAGGEWRQLPHLGDAGMGVHRPSQQLPHLGNAGMGVHRPSQQLPHLGNAGMGDDLRAYMAALSDRLRRVRVCCGDWSRVLGPTPTSKQGTTAVFLDPPYAQDERKGDLYAVETDVSAAVRAWAVANGDNPDLRIALCGYEGEHDMPSSWSALAWKAKGGYGSQADGRGAANAHRERIWFSPHCLDPARRQPTLWEAVS
jgi:DNA adenine methylase